MDYKKYCAICSKELGKHFNHLRIHNISSKEYYDRYLKTPNEEKCEICNNLVSFNSIKNGYNKVCSSICSGRRSNKLKYSNWKYKADILNSLQQIKTCESCNNEFIVYDNNTKYCNSHKCRRYKCSDPKNINDIININNISKCPYCDMYIKSILNLPHHLKKHFNEKNDPQFKNIYFHLRDIGYLPYVDNQCKSINCKNKTSFIGYKRGFNDHCDECIKLFSTNRTKWLKKKYTYDQRIDRYKKSSISMKNSYKKKLEDPEKNKILQEQWKHVGSINSIKMKQYVKTERGQKRIKEQALITSKKMKEKIQNGLFTPCITNSYTHWDAKIKINDNIIKFRSSWEACFWYCNQHLKYEKLRIKYIDKSNDQRCYIADFYDEENKILYEIKPKSQYLTQVFKMDCIINYCLKNNLKFIWINEFNILNYINESNFKDEINIIQLRKMKSGLPKN